VNLLEEVDFYFFGLNKIELALRKMNVNKSLNSEVETWVLT